MKQSDIKDNIKVFFMAAAALGACGLVFKCGEVVNAKIGKTELVTLDMK